jgi:hypothetical protein
MHAANTAANPVRMSDRARSLAGQAKQTAANFGRFAKAHAVQIVVPALVAMLVLFPQLVTHASTTITVDTDVMFSATNGWITTFLPIASIGLGIAIALAVIAFVGDAILQGFKRR